MVTPLNPLNPNSAAGQFQTGFQITCNLQYQGALEPLLKTLGWSKLIGAFGEP
jgi:hypothetical protein